MATAPENTETSEPPTQPLVSGTVGDRCVSCATPLTSDQRYCVACGERRGKPRFSLPPAGAAGEPAAQLVPVAAPPRPPRASPGTTIVAGVGTLLLAMGVGVLIGRSSANNVNKPIQAAAPTVVTVAGGGANGTASTGASPSAKTKSSSKGAKGKSKASANSAPKPTAAQAQKASQAAGKVLGSNANLPPATVTVGQTGHGPGYNKSGKFDGSFFGGG